MGGVRAGGRLAVLLHPTQRSPSEHRPGGESTVEVLVIDDSLADIRLIDKAAQRSEVSCRLHVVRDGVQALDFLRREGAYEGVPRPDLILLDLNLPRRDGREVLEFVKQDPALRSLPVVVLTTSESQSDVEMAYRLRANSYLVKPRDVIQFMEILKTALTFWSAHLPDGGERSDATRGDSRR